MKLITYIVLSIYYVAILSSCVATQAVSFKTPVDTTTKPIDYQKKQTYSLKKLGIYASNEFDGARLNGFEKKNDSTAIVIINPENEPINLSPYYAFKTWSDQPGNFYFTFQYPEGYQHRYYPKIKKTGNWKLIDSTHIFKKDGIVTIKLNLDKTPITIAAQEVQACKDVENWYTQLIAGKDDFIELKSAGKSMLDRNIPMLDICKGNKKGKELIVLMTRQHPPEVTGYYAFQYFMETILDDSTLSNDFLEKYRILVFPLMNPDGVDMGHWRHNAGGVDTNRDWAVYNQPEVKQVVKLITKIIKKDKTSILLGLDFHSTYEDVFYTNKQRKNTTLPNFIDDWFAALEKNIPGYKVNEASGNSTKPVSKGWFLYGHNATGITYEIGDHTPREKIILIGKTSAQEMMKILISDGG